ncbi:Uncharacterised protein [Mycobacterium tuberculosis]|nr:Uncharacterised protein [Mycobacterium tuberculosis]
MDGVQLRDLVKFLFTMIKTTQQGGGCVVGRVWMVRMGAL